MGDLVAGLDVAGEITAIWFDEGVFVEVAGVEHAGAPFKDIGFVVGDGFEIGKDGDAGGKAEILHFDGDEIEIARLMILFDPVLHFALGGGVFLGGFDGEAGDADGDEEDEQGCDEEVDGFGM